MTYAASESITLFDDLSQITGRMALLDLFPKRHRLVHNGGLPNLEALYCSLNMASSTKTS